MADLEERVDLLETPIYRRWLFYLNGWPRRPVVSTAQKWRPWHRWFGRRDRDYDNRLDRFVRRLNPRY